MTNNTITRSLSMLSLFALSTPLVFGGAPVEDLTAMQRQGVSLIREVEDAAATAQYHADKLRTFARSFQISRGTHANDLHLLGNVVNDQLRPALMKLETLQPQLPGWKQQSIDKMLAAAKALAADTNNAILAKREALNVPAAMNAEYRTLVDKVYLRASELVKLSDAAGTYAAARLKATGAGIPVATN